MRLLGPSDLIPSSQLLLPSDVAPTNDAPKGAGMQRIAWRPLICKLEPDKHHFLQIGISKQHATHLSPPPRQKILHPTAFARDKESSGGLGM